MPYQAGHPYHPPKELPAGFGRMRSKHAKELTLAVRASMGAQVFVDYHKAIAMGHANVKIAEDLDTGEVCVVYDDSSGSAPTQDERTKSVNWLADRGHGLPAQSIQVQQSVRAHMTSLTTSVNVGALTAGQIKAMRALLTSGARAALPPGVLESVDAAIEVTEGEAPAEDTEGEAPAEDTEGDAPAGDADADEGEAPAEGDRDR